MSLDKALSKLLKIAADHEYEVPKLPDELKFAKTDRERMYLTYIKELMEKVRQDFLTGLVHKEEFKSQEKGEGVYIFIDSDGLKKMNDTFGHAAGTAAILATADGIKKALRSRDKATVSRYGGDEFVVHIEDATLSAGVAVGKRILTSINSQNIANFYDGEDSKLKAALNELQLKASIGVGKTESDADKAVYLAKSRGRNRVEFYHSSMEPKLASAEIKILKFASKINQVKNKHAK